MFHVNSSTFAAEECKTSKKKDCPHGDASKHYKNYSEAYFSAEKEFDAKFKSLVTLNEGDTFDWERKPLEDYVKDIEKIKGVSNISIEQHFTEIVGELFLNNEHYEFSYSVNKYISLYVRKRDLLSESPEKVSFNVEDAESAKAALKVLKNEKMHSELFPEIKILNQYLKKNQISSRPNIHNYTVGQHGLMYSTEIRVPSKKYNDLTLRFEKSEIPSKEFKRWVLVDSSELKEFPEEREFSAGSLNDVFKKLKKQRRKRFWKTLLS